MENKKLDIKKIEHWIKNLKTKHIVFAFVVLGIIAFFLDHKQPTATSSPEVLDPTSVDTFIPQGMTLVPIEIQNIEALKNILGEFGIVDLYIPSYESGHSPRKVASGIKILRAPLNPDVFAVLVPEENAPQIAQNPGAFFVTVLNPKTQKSKFNIRKVETKTQIMTEN